MASAASVNTFTRAPFPTSTFITYLTASCLFLVVYTLAFLKVFKNENP